MHTLLWVKLMKRCLQILLAWNLILPMHVQASYVVISSDGTVIEEKESHQVQSVASISKIMTALVVLEHSELNEIVTISEEACHQVGSSIYLKPNQQVTLITLLHGLMLRSGNDAAYALAEHVGGSVEAFVLMMNEKAAMLGMKDTTFRNPSGLDEEDGGNQSTCYDMALCMKAAMENDVFRKIVSTMNYHGELGVWKNKNRLLSEYDACNGGKTGYTMNSGKTLVTSAQVGDSESIVVSFRESEYFDLHKAKHIAFFDQYQEYLILDEGVYKTQGIEFRVDQPFKLLVEKSKQEPFDIDTKIDKHSVTINIRCGSVNKSQTFPIIKQSMLRKVFS